MMISVCMATYNGEKYILEQVQSILKQLGENDELVISDDGSTDKTLELLNQICDSRIKVYLNNGKHGYTPNFENALKQSRGDYIFLSDQDDIWIHNKVELVMAEFSKGFDFVYSDCITINKNMDVIQESRIKTYNIKKGAFRTLVKMRYIGCCYAFRRNVLSTALPFPKRYDLLEHDAWLATVANFKYKVSIIEEPLIYYRRHGGNSSNGGAKSKNSLINMIIRRVYRLFCVLYRRKK